MSNVHTLNDTGALSSKVLSEMIRISSLGTELTHEESEALASIMGYRQVSHGEKVIDANDTAHTLFLLVEGQLAVVGPGNSAIDGAERIFYIMKPGECAGRRAFVDRSPRQATLRAISNVTVYTLEPDDFEGLLEKQPGIVYKIMRALFRTTHSNLIQMNMESEQLSNYIIRSRGRY